MKSSLLLTLIMGIIFSCHQPSGHELQLQKRIDSLELKLSGTYKPGFGEFMSAVQAHHAKLWFAGKYRNWALADFEIHEILEALDGITKYQSGRKESQLLPMLHPALDSMNSAIAHKSPLEFEKNYNLLTATCNKCHQATEFGFNVVKIPDQPVFSNQSFQVDSSH
jgi:hypothetical protein